VFPSTAAAAGVLVTVAVMDCLPLSVTAAPPAAAAAALL